MLTIYTIFMLSLVCAEKMWYFSADLRRRGHSRKVELLTMIAGCVIMGVGEIVVPYEMCPATGWTWKNLSSIYHDAYSCSSAANRSIWSNERIWED